MHQNRRTLLICFPNFDHFLHHTIVIDLLIGIHFTQNFFNINHRFLLRNVSLFYHRKEVKTNRRKRITFSNSTNLSSKKNKVLILLALFVLIVHVPQLKTLKKVSLDLSNPNSLRFLYPSKARLRFNIKAISCNIKHR